LLNAYRSIGGSLASPADVIESDIAYLSRDDILAQVAKVCCDMLVTNDRALMERSSGMAITYDAFRQRTGLH